MKSQCLSETGELFLGHPEINCLQERISAIMVKIKSFDHVRLLHKLHIKLGRMISVLMVAQISMLSVSLCPNNLFLFSTD